MAVLVIGGGGRGAGKTAVGCALIAALPELQWAAVKVSSHGHGALDAVTEESDVDSQHDTGRYLRAGARRGFLVSGEPPDATASVQRIRLSAAELDSLLVESNRIDWHSIAGEGEPGLVLAVIGDSWEKASLAGLAERADALVVGHDAELIEVAATVAGKRVFLLPEGLWTTDELVKFVRGRLLA